ncbi:MAG: RNA polymerase sigma factor [Pseudomonadota bacterium]|nr:RNA polymerase sigma factor [Pseudomonadota bacterium]
MTAALKTEYATLTDAELATGIAARNPVAVRLMTERNNQRLFRTAWSILGNRAEAEDAVQNAYLHAFTSIDDFAGRSSLSTWLTRIVINEALGRLRAATRRRARFDEGSVTDLDIYREKLMRGSIEQGADVALARNQLREILEAAIATLPRDFRTVFVMRDVEGMPVEEVAQALDLLPGTVRTRLLRARRRLREALAPELHETLLGVFPFAGVDCAGLTEKVVAKICGDP